MKPEEVHRLLRSRLSVYPPQYLDKSIDKEILQEILESANWAPTHKLTEPWRFKIFIGEGRKKLGDFLAEKYRSKIATENFSIAKYEKTKTNPVKSAAVIAICMKRDSQKRIPEWEEIAATACAVQNIWIAASSYKIGGYWSTPSYIEDLHELVDLEPDERCIGFFYMGYYKPMGVNRKRSPIAEKSTWIE